MGRPASMCGGSDRVGGAIAGCFKAGSVTGQCVTRFGLPDPVWGFDPVIAIGHAHLGIPERTKSREVIKVFKEYRNTP